MYNQEADIQYTSFLNQQSFYVQDETRLGSQQNAYNQILELLKLQQCSLISQVKSRLVNQQVD